MINGEDIIDEGRRLLSLAFRVFNLRSSIMTINTRACIFVSLPLSGSIVSRIGAFILTGIDLSCRGIVMVECCEESWLRPSSQDLFSPRV